MKNHKTFPLFIVLANIVLFSNISFAQSNTSWSTSSNTIGIGTSSPESTLKLEVVGNGNSTTPLRIRNNTSNILQLQTFSTTSYTLAGLGFYKARGSASTPNNVVAGDRIGGLYSYGYFDGGFQLSSAMEFYVAGNVGPNSYPSYMIFATTAPFETSRTERMRIDEHGNVGIGTSGPKDKLEVTGAVSTRAWDGVFKSRYENAVYDLIGTYQGWNKNTIYIAGYNQSNHPDYITNKVVIGAGTNGETKSSYFNLLTGAVGIGVNDTKGYKLAVAGKMVAEEVNVKLQANWPDYVFDNSYALRSLAEVEQYIQENKHLPNIPSAQEVKENGIDLGSMDAKLLQKIEELTLYMIQLKKENELIQAENQALKERIEKLEQK